jgi:hypothetical protein
MGDSENNLHKRNTSKTIKLTQKSSVTIKFKKDSSSEPCSIEIKEEEKHSNPSDSILSLEFLSKDNSSTQNTIKALDLAQPNKPINNNTTHSKNKKILFKDDMILLRNCADDIVIDIFNASDAHIKANEKDIETTDDQIKQEIAASLENSNAVNDYNTLKNFEDINNTLDSARCEYLYLYNSKVLSGGDVACSYESSKKETKKPLVSDENGGKIKSLVTNLLSALKDDMSMNINKIEIPERSISFTDALKFYQINK